jgi:hypothetical protein
VIRQWQGLPASANLNEAGGNTIVTYDARGETTGVGSFDFTAYYDDCTGENTREIEVDAAGRTSVTRNDSKCS